MVVQAARLKTMLRGKRTIMKSSRELKAEVQELVTSKGVIDHVALNLRSMGVNRADTGLHKTLQKHIRIRISKDRCRIPRQPERSSISSDR